MSRIGYGRVSAEEPLNFSWRGVNSLGLNVEGEMTMNPDQLADFVLRRFKQGWHELVIYRGDVEVARMARKGAT